MILAGDVGGTKTALALFADDGTPIRETVAPSREFAGLEQAVARFLAQGERVTISAACFGVAGPVAEGRSVTTNLPWHVDARALAAAIPAGRVTLLNDLEATAHGVLELPPAALVTLQSGRPRRGTMVVIAAGTGLGEAIVAWDGADWVVLPSEGGHADFGPRSEVEDDLLRFLRKEFGHVSYERVLSGPGLVNVYRFLRAAAATPEPGWLTTRLATEDPGAVVTAVGLAGDDPLCVRALERFVAIYGAAAGNLALKALAIGGVFVAGGIAPRILPLLAGGAFLEAFADKGRLGDLLRAIPVHVVREPRTALLGAARVARGARAGAGAAA